MKSFFDGVRRHIGNMDAEHLREQYRRLSDEVSSLDTLFSTISQGIIVLDERGEVAKSNPAARELLGMDPEDALPMLAVAHGKSSKREIDITYPETRSLEIQTMPMGDGTLVCLRDVTAERERTEEELRIGATRAVRDLAAGVAHEIGNPLNALSLNLQLLKRSGGEKPEVDECIRQVERLSGIKNALEAVRDGGSIDIVLSSDDNDVITTVRDDGQGMTPEQVAHLFEPYRTSKEHGTGLGLMISSRIVRDHGGSISVESEPGEGTAFTIRLPRIERRIRALKG